jgi:hypothetical protein
VQFLILPPKNTFNYRSPFHRRACEYSARAERIEGSFRSGGNQGEILESDCIRWLLPQRLVLFFIASKKIVWS